MTTDYLKDKEYMCLVFPSFFTPTGFVVMQCTHKRVKREERDRSKRPTNARRGRKKLKAKLLS